MNTLLIIVVLVLILLISLKDTKVYKETLKIIQETILSKLPSITFAEIVPRYLSPKGFTYFKSEDDRTFDIGVKQYLSKWFK